jgi:hypothetical protein
MVRYTGDPTTEIPQEARELMKRWRPSAEDEQRLDDLIAFLEATTAEDWCVDVVRTDDPESGPSKNCVFGHIFNWGQVRGDGSDRAGSRAWDWFESAWTTTYQAYPVNDGEVSYYQQPTARERSIAFLRDLRSGAVPCTVESMNWDYYGHDIEAVREGEA